MNLSIIWFVSTLFLSQVWREMERKKILNRNDFYFSLEAFYDFYYIIIQKYGISPSEGLPPPPHPWCVNIINMNNSAIQIAKFNELKQFSRFSEYETVTFIIISACIAKALY